MRHQWLALRPWTSGLISHDLGPLSENASDSAIRGASSCLPVVPLLWAWTWGAKLSFTLVGFVVALEKTAAKGDLASSLASQDQGTFLNVWP